jgi:hypothetical protein
VVKVATIAKRNLTTLGTAELIGQYSEAISTYAGRLTNTSPRQQRINYIVDLLSDRADNGDPEALKFLE